MHKLIIDIDGVGKLEQEVNFLDRFNNPDPDPDPAIVYEMAAEAYCEHMYNRIMEEPGLSWDKFAGPIEHGWVHFMLLTEQQGPSDENCLQVRNEWDILVDDRTVWDARGEFEDQIKRFKRARRRMDEIWACSQKNLISQNEILKWNTRWVEAEHACDSARIASPLYEQEELTEALDRFLECNNDDGIADAINKLNGH